MPSATTDARGQRCDAARAGLVFIGALKAQRQCATRTAVIRLTPLQKVTKRVVKS